MTRNPSIQIEGAGLMGRVLGLALRRRGLASQLTDIDPSGESACAWTGAGMLAPASELDGGEALVYELGKESMGLWPDLLGDLSVPLQMAGTLIVAHPNDRREFERFRRALDTGGATYERASAARIAELEPDVSFPEALYLPHEGQVYNRDLIEATNHCLDIGQAAPPSSGPTGAPVASCAERNRLAAPNTWQVDCRGLAARDLFPDLRGVRGELLHVHAPDVTLRRPVRILHPRYPLYVVPREGQTFVIGASQIESEDHSAISVRTTLELLSAAYALHPGFAEGRLIDTSVNCRPAFPDHRPRMYIRRDTATSGRIAINGLYRHGFLLAPILAHFAAELIEKGIEPPASIVHAWPA